LAKLKAKAVITNYWMPGENFLDRIVEGIREIVKDGDIVTVSEKAISTALGNLVDESGVKPSRTAHWIVKYWIRIFWGYVLGPLCHLRSPSIERLRGYPIKEGAAHKEVALRHTSFPNALMPWSEGGIDGSNLPYSYVSLPLKNPRETAEKIRSYIKLKLGKKVTVIIVDTDKTYSLRNFHFTPRPSSVRGIYSTGGFLAYFLGRFLRLKRRATPLAVAGAKISAENALRAADLANKVQGFGAGPTVWDMTKTFNVPLTGVTWEMLNRVKHKPIVVIRLVRDKKNNEKRSH